MPRVRNVSDLFYLDLFKKLAVSHSNFEPTVVLSQPDPTLWTSPRGRVTDLIRQQVTRDEAENSEVYICGGRPMIEDVKRLLIEKGLKAEHVHRENFF